MNNYRITFIEGNSIDFTAENVVPVVNDEGTLRAVQINGLDVENNQYHPIFFNINAIAAIEEQIVK